MAAATEIHLLRAAGPERLAARPTGAAAAGVYTGLRTFRHDRFLWLEAHLARLDANIAALGWDYALDHGVVRRGLHAVVTAFPAGDARVRLDVLAAGPVDERIVCELTPRVPVPAEFLAAGVGIATTRALERRRPRIKTSSFIEERKPYPLQDQECYEHVMLSADGRLLEGTSSNFFGARDGVLLTSGEDVLEGITRKVFLFLADRAGISVDLAGVRLSEVATLDEAFITSSSRGLVPVRAIDGRGVGDGVPGPVARRLLRDYEVLAEHEARPAIESPGESPGAGGVTDGAGPAPRR